jgi:1,4-dihydroxy-2-naphthoate octaprenyltransferase
MTIDGLQRSATQDPPAGGAPAMPGPGSHVRAWLAAARPATLPASIVPVVVGTAASGRGANLRVPVFLAALAASILIQIGTNYANDYFDHVRKADTGSRLGPRRLIQLGIATPRGVLAAGLLCFGLAALLGLYLIWAAGQLGPGRGWPILVIGIISILSGLGYTGGPFPLAYHALGDLFCFVCFGVLAVTGSAYLQNGAFTGWALAASIPVGFLVTAILVVNNLRDIPTDRPAGKRTLAVILGPPGTRVEYALLLLGAYLAPPAMWLFDHGSATLLLPWLSLPLAAPTLRTVMTQEGPPLNLALKATGRLHLLFGLLLAIGLWW